MSLPSRVGSSSEPFPTDQPAANRSTGRRSDGVDNLDRKLNDAFPGFVVRKNLVKLVRGNAAVPSRAFKDIEKHIQ